MRAVPGQTTPSCELEQGHEIRYHDASSIILFAWERGERPGRGM